MTTPPKQHSSDQQPGYKLTKLGWLPVEWEVVRLDEITKYRRGSFPQPYGLKKWYDDEGFPFVQVYDVDSNFRLKPETKQKISDLAKEKSIFVAKDSIVITIQGSIGRIAKTQYDACVDRTLLIITDYLRDIDKDFFIHALYTLFKKEERFAPGGTIKTITKSKLSAFKIPLPPLPEQTAIANCLATWDRALTTTRELLTTLQQRKKGLMQALLTGRRRLPGFEGEWEEVRAGLLFKNISDKKHDGSLEVLSATQENGIIPRSEVGINIKYNKSSLKSYKRVKRGDFVISLRSFQGGIEYSRYDGLVSPAYTVIRKCVDLDKSFYRDYLKTETFINRLNAIIYGIRDGKQISYKEFSALKFRVPPLEEQTAIAAVLTAADREITLHQQKLATLEAQKKGLMQQLLTGQKRLV